MEFKVTTQMLENLLFTSLIERYIGSMKYEKCSVYDKLSADWLVVDREHAITVMRELAEDTVNSNKKFAKDDKAFFYALCELSFEVSKENLNYLYERLVSQLTLD